MFYIPQEPSQENKEAVNLSDFRPGLMKGGRSWKNVNRTEWLS